jgi:hypothetical protein
MSRLVFYPNLRIEVVRQSHKVIQIIQDNLAQCLDRLNDNGVDCEIIWKMRLYIKYSQPLNLPEFEDLPDDLLNKLFDNLKHLDNLKKLNSSPIETIGDSLLMTLTGNESLPTRKLFPNPKMWKRKTIPLDDPRAKEIQEACL